MKKVLFLILLMLTGAQVVFSQKRPKERTSADDRSYWVSTLDKVAFPVLDALSKGELHKKMPVEERSKRETVTHLEAIGRLFAGMAPWLELGPDSTAEGKLREKYIRLTIRALENAVDPGSPDFMNFTEDTQPLVDAAFLSLGLLRAPNQIWNNLSTSARKNMIAALRSTRVIIPRENNWLMFSASIEAALLKFGGESDWDEMRVEYAVNKLMDFFKGDGAYGDGPHFRWDYYNSFVMQPMLLEVLKVAESNHKRIGKNYALILSRAKRYAEVQERLISPEGTYPAFGRSLAYRCGAFQLLAQAALWKELPESLAPAQVRCALTAVIKRTLSCPGTFDKDGWLTIGLCGHQPEIGEGYISTGSLYLCAVAFLPLGLPANNEFWSGAAIPWTSQKIWSGKTDFRIDHAVDK